jgi:broad specificity phosphatase PhoE
MPTKIFLMRHGETELNRNKAFRGRYDIGLNDMGRRQAVLLRDELKNSRIAYAFTSPLIRAAETAKIVLEPHCIEALACEELTDIDYGSWTGLPETEVKRLWPDRYAQWQDTPYRCRIPEGELLGDVYARAFCEMENIAKSHNGCTIAIFSHRVINKLLVIGALDLNIDSFNKIIQDNCCFNEFERNGHGYIIKNLNVTSHLKNNNIELPDADF